MFNFYLPHQLHQSHSFSRPCFVKDLTFLDSNLRYWKLEPSCSLLCLCCQVSWVLWVLWAERTATFVFKNYTSLHFDVRNSFMNKYIPFLQWSWIRDICLYISCVSLQSLYVQEKGVNDRGNWEIDFLFIRSATNTGERKEKSLCHHFHYRNALIRSSLILLKTSCKRVMGGDDSDGHDYFGWWWSHRLQESTQERRSRRTDNHFFASLSSDFPFSSWKDMEEESSHVLRLV